MLRIGSSRCCFQQFSKGGTVCRESATECDLPEYCSGTSADCPRDVLKRPSSLSLASDPVFHTEGPKGDEGGNILDLVLTRREELIDEVQIRGVLDASDHSILCFEIRGLGTGSGSSTRSWDFKRANFGQLKARLGKVSWNGLREGKRVEEGWMALKREVLEAKP
ncbi:Disintegrin and metalloproteinase domain-containing protein 26A [Varanus komodoensis]|nr:Disintegrin and metalloproteinase domain-containing protein 26A [Varanus komodoensis]